LLVQQADKRGLQQVGEMEESEKIEKKIAGIEPSEALIQQQRPR
jgi:hypothetical protein